MPFPTRRWIVAATVLLLLFVVLPTTAADQGWLPPEAGGDTADWVGLESGEWLRGRIGDMYEGKLEFHSDGIGTVKIPWTRIRTLRCSRISQVALLDRPTAVGRLEVESGTVRVVDADGREVAAAPLGEVLAVTVGDPRERNYWSGRVRAGLNARSGNTEQLETNLLLDSVRRTPRDRLRIGYLGNLTDTAGRRTADNHRATAVWDRFVSDRFYLTPLNGEFYRDPFQNVAARWTLGAGLGWQVVRTSRSRWNVNGSLGFQHTSFHAVDPGKPSTADTPSLSLGTRYETRLTGWLRYLVDLNTHVVDSESGRFTSHLRTGFDLGLFRKVGVSLFWVWDHIQEPRPGKDGAVPKRNDFRTILSVGYDF